MFFIEISYVQMGFDSSGVEPFNNNYWFYKIRILRILIINIINEISICGFSSPLLRKSTGFADSLKKEKDKGVGGEEYS